MYILITKLYADFSLVWVENSDHYMVVAKVRERLAVSKPASQMFEGERFNLSKLNELGD
jgi:hypothetical protein